MPNQTPTKCVSATDLAKLQICEQQVFLAKKYGSVNNEDTKRGIKAHQKFERASLYDNLKDYNQKQNKRCYIATELYGEDHCHTLYLRAWRDQCLLNHAWGQWLIAGYYSTSKVLIKTRFFKLPVVKYCVDKIVRGVIKCLKTFYSF